MKKTEAARFLARFRVSSKHKSKIGGRQADDKCGFAGKSWAHKELKKERHRLQELQSRLYAQGTQSLLVVLQAMDTGGKDGTIRRVLGPLNPQGVEVTSFKRPTQEELAHDYLWRVHKAIPRAGMIGVFNRSQYEDVLAVRVHGLRPRREVERRYEQINAFEKHLAENGTTVVKLCLNITRKEQKERLQARLDNPDKHWKFELGDLAERKLWPDYMRAYDLALRRCSTEWAPWYLVPANRKWVRDLVVARILRWTMEGMKLRYPRPAEDLSRVVIDD